MTLSPREIEVLRFVCKGKSNKDIGKILNITEKTVKFHITNIFAKKSVKSRAELICQNFDILPNEIELFKTLMR